MTLKFSASPVIVATIVAASLPLLACAAGSGSAPARTAPASTASAAPTATKAPAAPVAATPAPAAPAATPATDELVVLDTTAGRVVLDLYEDKAPGHAENMKKLVRQGYYDNSPFHRVIDGFMAQGGGQWAAGGQIGDAGYTQPAEIVAGLSHQRGTVAAARTGDHVNPERRSSGSQFYICFAPTSWLDGQYSIFGEVVSGMENVDKLVKGPKERNGAVDPGEASKVLRAWLEPRAATAPAAAATK